jgi:hypoxanthine phosphoribosyltransferase
MSPTVFRHKNYRFFFFSKEEERMHVHVSSQEGEAKFWIEPIVALAYHYNFTEKQLNEIQKIVEEKKNEIKKEWKKHFKS